MATVAPGVALFDMDDTLVGANTAALYFARLRQTGALSRWQALRIAWAYLGYRLNVVDMARLIVQGAASTKGQSSQAMAALCAGIFEEQVRPLILPAAIRCVRNHQERGHAVAIVTASTPYIARLVAQELGIATLLATELAVTGDLFTGALVGAPCFGAEKVGRAQDFAAQHGCTLRDAWFYTDSHSDLPLLQAVGHPQIVRPDLRLRWAAQRNGWPVLDW